MNVNELPQYKCHKVVRAGKISAIDTDIDKGLLIVNIVGISQPFEFPSHLLRMRSAETGGYLVVYEDGYVSYSPAAAFEAGYSIIIDKDSNGTVLTQKADGTEALHFQDNTPPAEASGLKAYAAMDGSVVYAGEIREWLHDEMEESARIRVEGCADLLEVSQVRRDFLSIGNILLKTHDGRFRVMTPLAFYSTYKPFEPFAIDMAAADFSDALMWLKEGKRVQRSGWNGAGQWVELVKNSGLVFRSEITGEFYAVADGLVLKNAQDIVVQWVPSIGDLMAEDWQVVA